MFAPGMVNRSVNIELGGTAVGQFDRLRVFGEAFLAGDLNLSLINSYVPALGDSFDIFDWSTVHEVFTTVNLPALGGGLAWNTSQLYTTGTLFVGGAVGDYNHDGSVDAADYVIWRKTLGQTGAGLAADGNFNNIIDSGDFTAWRSHYQLTAGSGSSATSRASVPEPSTWLLLLLSAAVMGFRRHHNFASV
jgi:hypothetical protein